MDAISALKARMANPARRALPGTHSTIIFSKNCGLSRNFAIRSNGSCEAPRRSYNEELHAPGSASCERSQEGLIAISDLFPRLWGRFERSDNRFCQVSFIDEIFARLSRLLQASEELSRIGRNLSSLMRLDAAHNGGEEPNP